MPVSLSLSDFDYHLPAELIAQAPVAVRSTSRLLHVDGDGRIKDLRFSDLISLLRTNDLLVLNDTQVIQARLLGKKDSGGKVEVLVERITEENQALAHVRASKSPGAGTSLILAEKVCVDVLGRSDDLFVLKFDRPVLEALAEYGAVPLPPYITHQPDAHDIERYQTVYAREPGAVAAPTAGLHFDQEMFDQLDVLGVKRAFVTLHVGAGTFQPVRDNNLETHIMHAERYTVPQATIDAIAQTRARGGRVIAVGTTSVRALESAAQLQPALTTAQSGDTRLFITPGFRYQVVDAMVTNFHLPQSTLLMLVAAFVGLNEMKAAYQHAIAQRYRFFSYGDAMFLERKKT
ncbi:MAG: tRNA preQ1(34) S-adenosylmethionine ribosyltransferase-isomerase QueA [Betaproteobacteria bacterium]